MMILNKQITQKFENNLAGIDLIIGAKGSPLQLVLNGLYHIDAPTGNIPLKEVQAFMNPNHPVIKKRFHCLWAIATRDLESWVPIWIFLPV